MITNNEYVKIWNYKVTAYFEALGSPIAHTLRRWLLAAETHVQTRMTSSEITSAGARFSPSLYGFSLLIAILRLFHTHFSPLREVCVIPDQAAHYHILGLLSTGLYL
jgi:hypothetical protein